MSAVIVVIIGTCITDYSFNYIMKNEQKLELLTFHSLDDNMLEIDILNKKLILNTKYLTRDYNRLKNKFFSWTGL